MQQKKQIRSKGFTLIELLIVVTVIGLLSAAILVGLSGVRSRGRDTRRIADLRQVQNGLEIYFNSNGTYPRADGSSADIRWANLTQTLVGASIGVSALPRDPLNRDPYFYDYGVGSNGLNYVLSSVLENADNQALRDSPNGDIYGVYCGAGGASDTIYCIQQ